MNDWLRGGGPRCVGAALVAFVGKGEVPPRQNAFKIVDETGNKILGFVGVARVLAERLGHARSSISLDVYSHTLDPGEVPVERFLALIDR